MRAGVLAVAVFRSVAAGASGSGDGTRPVSEIVADVSIDSPQGALVDREKLDDAVTLLVRSGLIEAEEDRLTLTAEGDHFWRRISHLPPSSMKKWIREAVKVYSRGEEFGWAISDKAWSDAQDLFLSRHRSRMATRLEALEGFLAALDNWHLVSSLIGAAADREAAIAALQGVAFFSFTKLQATQIVDMKMSQRTALARLSLAEERDAIRAELDELTKDDLPIELDASPKKDVPHGTGLLEQTIGDIKYLVESHKGASGGRGDRPPGAETDALEQST